MKTQNIFVVVISIFSLILFIFSSGCNNNDSIVNTVNSDINGIVVDDNNNPINNVNVELVTMYDFVITRTLSDGRFHFSNVTSPYSLNVTNGHYNTYKKVAYVYDGLTEVNPNILIGEINQYVIPKNAYLHIKTPDTAEVNYKSYILAIYDSLENLYCIREINNVYDDEIYFIWYGNNESANANVFLISKQQDYISNKKYYYNYFEKKVNITNGGHSNIVLNYSDMKNVEENKVVTFISPSGWDGNYISLGLTFSEQLMNEYYGMELGNNSYPTAAINYPIISSKNLFYYYSVISFNTSKLASYSWNNRFMPTNSVYLTTKQIPESIYPTNEQQGVDRNTHFKISDADNSGIYQYTIRRYNQGNTIYLMTKNTGFFYPNIKDTNFVLTKNAKYEWNIAKYYNTQSMDLLVKNKYGRYYIPDEMCYTKFNCFTTNDTL